MPIPTDRGYAIIKKNAGGTVSVGVSASPPAADGPPERVYASHVRIPTVKVSPHVTLAGQRDVRWSTSPVQVFVDDKGVVNVAPVTGTGAATAQAL